MAINTFFRVELARSAFELPLTMWATDINLLARISVALEYKNPAIAVEKYEVKKEGRA